MGTARRRVAAIVLAGTALVATGCPVEPPGPSAPVWTAAHTGGQPPPGAANPLHFAIGTNAGWFAEIDAGGGATSRVVVSPRTGTGGSELGAPQSFPANPIGLGGGLLSEHYLLTGLDPTSTSTDLQFFGESGGTWSKVGTFRLDVGASVRALTDDVLVTQQPGAFGGVRAMFIEMSEGRLISRSAQTLAPPVSWGPGYDTYWGNIVSLDGGLLAVSSHSDAGGPDRVAVYRRATNGLFVLEATLERPDFDALGLRLAIDDRPGPDHLAVVGVPDGSARSAVVVYDGSAGGWTEQATLGPPAGVPDVKDGAAFGGAIALDGDLLVVTAVAETMTTPGPAGISRLAYRPVVYRFTGSGWGYETSLDVVAEPADTDGIDRGLVSLVVSGNHVVGTIGVGLPGSCSWCTSARFEAWRWDRSLA